MRIGIINEFYYDPDYVNGIRTFIDNVRGAWADMGASSVILPLYDQHRSTNRYPVVWYPELSCQVIAQPDLDEMERCDVVLVVAEGFMSLLLATYAKNVLGTPVVWNMHSDLKQYFACHASSCPQRAFDVTLWYFGQLFDHVIPVSPHIAAQLAPGLPCTPIPNGTDKTRFVPVTPISRHPTGHLCRSIIYVGRLSEEKNIRKFCRIKVPCGYQKTVVGDGPLRPELEEMYPAIRFIGNQSGDDLVRLYQQATLLVFPSKTDTYGLVVREALRCGCVVASYDVPCLSDLNSLRGCGVFAGRSLSKQVVCALEFAETRPQYCTNEMPMSSALISWAECGGRYLECLQKLTNRV